MRLLACAVFEFGFLKAIRDAVNLVVSLDVADYVGVGAFFLDGPATGKPSGMPYWSKRTALF